MELGWRLISTLPRQELDRISSETLDKYYIEDKDLLERKNKIDFLDEVESDDNDDDIDDNDDN